MREILFPSPPRRFRGQRALKVLLRGLHVLCVALFVGAVAYDAPAAERAQALWSAAGSGCLLLLLDLYETAAFMVQVRGLVLLAKLLGLAALPYVGDAQLTLLAALVVVSVASSHAPAKVRYFVVIGHGRIEAARTPG